MPINQKKLIVANWKMNPTVLREAVALASGIVKALPRSHRADIVIAPPTPYLASLKKIFIGKRISLGAQNMHFENEGAHTGEVSGKMLRSLDVKYVILGHSERRADGETDQIINMKLKAALKNGLTPIVCVGEESRDQAHQYLGVLQAQILATFATIPAASLAKITIAYEPVWAVGVTASREATPEESTEMVIFIRRVLADVFGAKAVEGLHFLYGGSVNPKNARDFLERGGVDGLLVGRDSLRKDTFSRIIKATTPNETN